MRWPPSSGKRQWFNVPPADHHQPHQGRQSITATVARLKGSDPTDEILERRRQYPYQSHELWVPHREPALGQAVWPISIPRRSSPRSNREDLWRTAAKNIGAAEADVPKTTSRGKETFFDGKVFDPADPKAYSRLPADQEGA